MVDTSNRGMSLFTDEGTRKYLTPSERRRFAAALEAVEDPSARSFCAMLYWTGCRPSEALALTPSAIDLEEQAVIFRSLKKRGELKGRHFRAVPIPGAFAADLDRIHGLERAQGESRASARRLWRFGRTTAWRRVHAVMGAAGLTGAKACAKGLRHSYGVTAALSHVPETRIKKWLGHASLATTEIYLDVTGPEDRAFAERMW